ncbi:MAG: exo-alpha-sialidase [Clostridiaceae bacterium]|nr:exo-alpha-sialidase [Clostridiaceae bacterium]
MRNYLRLNTLTKDGTLYENPALGTVEALISNAPYRSCHAADLLELENGDLLCCWFAGSAEGNADISIVLARLKAGESRWSDPVKVTDDASKSEQNPSLFLAPTGEIWLVYTAQDARTPETGSFNLQYTAEIRCKKSADGGYTWGDEEVLFPEKGSFCRQKIQILSDGRWIFGNWRCFNDDTHNGSDITVIQISDDEGKSWREVLVPGSRGRVHANIVEMSPGCLAAFFRSRSADAVYRSVSDDNGDTWTEPVRTELPNNNSSISVIRLPNGHLAAAFNPVRFNDDPKKTVWPALRCPVALAVSEDGGKTWPYRRIAEAGDGYTGAWNEGNNRRYEYPVIMQGRDGAIHAAWSWGDRACVKYMRVDEKWIRGKEKKAGGERNPTLELEQQDDRK